MHSYITKEEHMTPNDVKELLKSLISEEGLPIDLIDIAPSQDFRSLDSTMESRIKDVIHQWNTEGKIHNRQPGRTEIMEFYSKTDSDSAAIELLESLDVEVLLETIITEENLPFCFTNQGFRLITLAEDDTTNYPVKILHGGINLEKKSKDRIQSLQLKGVVKRFEKMLDENRVKAKLFHRGFSLEKISEEDMLISQVKSIAKKIDDTFGINYVLNSYNYLHSDAEERDSTLKSASICISLWRFPRR